MFSFSRPLDRAISPSAAYARAGQKLVTQASGNYLKSYQFDHGPVRPAVMFRLCGNHRVSRKSWSLETRLTDPATVTRPPNLS
ncbi:MAG: hypothetical protein D6741_02710 [Planctomycetota bacterium]|nr:MAG: hypothetical protein D6741_02710 [Planctomycetota bacterium]